MKNKIAVYLLLLLTILPAHLFGADQMVTFDEPWWVISGSNYYYALTHRDFETTIYDYHPAVTTTWVVTAGMLSYFPEYRGYGQGYFDVRKPHYENFLREHDKEALDVLRISRQIQTVVIAISALVAFYLLSLLVGDLAAFFAIAFFVNAPFFLGFSRLINHEGMLSLFSLVSVLAMQVYVNRHAKPVYVLISGIAFGLAQLTKSSSIVIAPLAGLILFIAAFKTDGGSMAKRVARVAVSYLSWLAVAALVYVILWPGMWVAPKKMLFDVYGNAFSYAFQGARLDVTEEVQPSSFNPSIGLAAAKQYLIRWQQTATPLTWAGLALALLAFVLQKKEDTNTPLRSTMIYLSILALLFVAIFSISQGRDSPHYVLTGYVALDVVAGLGWAWLVARVQNGWRILNVNAFALGAGLALCVAQFLFARPYYPYYFTYHNHLTGEFAYGYGEGLEQAAFYLAAKPDAKTTRVYAYAGMGAISFYYPGEVSVLKKAYLTEEGMPSIIHDMRETDYLVLYSGLQNRQPESVQLLESLQGVKPERVFYIRGIEYVTIYKMSDIPESVYEALAK